MRVDRYKTINIPPNVVFSGQSMLLSHYHRRLAGLMVSEIDCFELQLWHCVLLLGKTLYSCSAPLHPGHFMALTIIIIVFKLSLKAI